MNLKSRILQWKMDRGLAWRGRKPDNWKPKPQGFLAWAYRILFMWRAK